MSIRPTKGLDHSWYAKSDTLDAKAATDFPSLVKRLQLFNRDSVLLMVSTCTWYAATLQPEDPRLKADINYVLTRYSFFVGALALIFCDKHGKATVDEVDLRILTGELFNIGCIEPGAPWFTSHEVVPLQTRIRELAVGNPLIAKITVDDVGPLNSFLLMARTALIQWDGHSFSKADWIRAALLYDRYKEIAIERGYCSESELRQAEGQFIGTTPGRLMKSVLLLIMLFSSSSADKKNPPGALDPRAAIFSKEVEEKFDFTNGDIGVAVSRFSVNVSVLPMYRAALEKLPPRAWLCSRELWPLREFPLVCIDDKEPNRLVISISPQSMFSKCAKLLQFDILQFFDTNNIFGAKQRAFVLKGAALEEYVSDRSKGTSMRRVDSLVPSTYKGKRPDFIWAGQEWTILFEVKANIKMNSDQTFFNSASLVDSWNILTEPIEQCCEMLKLGVVASKKTCLVILTNDNLCEPMTSFKRVAKHWEFLKGTGIDCLALLSLSQLETALSLHSPDSVGKNLSDTWEKLDPLSVDGKVLDYDFFDAHKHKLHIPDHVENKFRKLFPGLDIDALSG